MPGKPDSAFQVGTWRVEPQLNQLVGEHGTVQLEPKTMAVLVCLHERIGEVVSVDELVDAVWGSRPMGDNPVYKAIAKLRRALDDDPKDPRLIVTVPRMGYRLMPSDAAAPAGADTSARRGLLASALPIAIGLVLGVALAAAVFWRPAHEDARIQPVSTFAGSHSQPSFGPDSESFAFVNDAGGASHIWVVLADEGVPRQLTFGNRRDTRPRFSPDGKSILFVRSGSLYVVDIDGGEPREVLRNASNPNWSRDGRRIVFERRYEVWTADADGGRQERVERVPRRELALAPRWPAFSPDGQTIAYLDADSTPLADLWLIPLAGGSPEQLTFEPAFAGSPVWSADGRYIYYSTQRGGSRTLWRVDVASKRSEALLTGSGDDDFPDVSPDGSRLIYSNSRERFVLTASDPRGDIHRKLHESRLPIVGPELSPDGKSILFFGGARSGGYQIFVQDLAEGLPRMLTSNPAATYALPNWGQDGRSIYYYLNDPGPSFGRLDVESGEHMTVVDGWDWNIANGAREDPSGSRLIYSRLSGQAPVQTLIRDLASGSDESFHATLEYPRWRASGEEVVGSKFVDQRFPGDVAVCEVERAQCRTIAAGARVPVFNRDESALYFVRGFGLQQTLHVAPADGSGEEEELMVMEPLFPLGPFFAVTDDEEIVWVRHHVEPSEIWIAEL